MMRRWSWPKVLPVSSWKNASATMSLQSFKNFTGFLSLSAFSLNLQFLPSASLTTLFQSIFLAPSLYTNLLGHFVLLLKGFSLFLQHLLNLPLAAPSLPQSLGSGILFPLTLETSHLSLSSNPVLSPISLNLHLIFKLISALDPTLWLNVFFMYIFCLLMLSLICLNIWLCLNCENDKSRCIV